MAELVDATALGAVAERRGGSSPLTRTTISKSGWNLRYRGHRPKDA